jgi:uncharacterized membrane protein
MIQPTVSWQTNHTTYVAKIAKTIKRNGNQRWTFVQMMFFAAVPLNS